MNDIVTAAGLHVEKPVKYARFCLLLLLTTACTPAPDGVENAAAQNVSAETSAPASPINGEVPGDLLDSIIQDLLGRENLQRDNITVERAESVIWPDGSLGCPRPGEMYTHATVPGYWVVLQSNGRQFDYRASAKGAFIRCDQRLNVTRPVG